MRIAFLIVGLLSAFLNCGLRMNLLYAVSAVCLFLWFAVHLNDPSTQGERVIATVSIVGCLSAVLYMFETTGAAAQVAFYVTSVVITSCLIFSKNHS